MNVNRNKIYILILIIALLIGNVYFFISYLGYRDRYSTVYENSLLEYYNVFSELNSIVNTEKYNKLTEENLNIIKWHLEQVKVINNIITLDSDLFMISSFILNKALYILNNYYGSGVFTQDDIILYEQIKEEIYITYKTVRDEFLIKDRTGFIYNIDKNYDREKIRKLYKLTKASFNKLASKQNTD